MIAAKEVGVDRCKNSSGTKTDLPVRQQRAVHAETMRVPTIRESVSESSSFCSVLGRQKLELSLTPFSWSFSSG
jgi:hypothetical protein